MSEPPVPDDQDPQLQPTAPAAEPAAPAAAVEDEKPPMGLGQRLRQPRTILSIAIPLLLLVLIARFALNIDVGEVVAGIAEANPWLLLAALGVFYLGFPLRRCKVRRLP